MNESRRPESIPPKKSTGIKILFIVLIVWAIVIAVGTFQTQASTDFRRPLIVVAIMGVFLGGWGIALWAKRQQ